MADEYFGSLGSNEEDARRDMRPIREVLVVDADPAWAPATQALLESQGFNVHHAQDAGQAESFCRLNQPDFIVMELILPAESGFELCDRMKRKDATIPVLIYSVIDMETARDLAARCGADGYLVKPGDPAELAEMIHRLGRVVYDRHRLGEGRTLYTIQFACTNCDHRMSATDRHRGRFVTCPECEHKVQVPKITQNFRKDALNFRSGSGSSSSTRFDPREFLRVRCQHCGLRYVLYEGRKVRNCPSCGKAQEGAVKISSDPVARAALISSRRVLVLRNGPNRGKKLLLPSKTVTIGRSEECQIRFVDEQIADRHCTLKPVEGGILVFDLGAPGGTFIDEVRVEGKATLQPGHMLRVGKYHLQLALNQQLADIIGEETKSSQKSGPRMSMPKATTTTSASAVATEAASIIQLYWEQVRQTTLAE